MNNYIYFKDYNDYELIYLIKEGNELALNFFFDKYEKYIKKVVCLYIYYADYRIDDFIQEGRILLYECIYKYDNSSEASFFSYFTIALKRRIIKLIQYENKNQHILCEDSLIDYIPKKSYKKYQGKQFFEDELKIKIFDNCIVGNTSLKEYARVLNISYNKIYYLYQKMLEELKDIF